MGWDKSLHKADDSAKHSILADTSHLAVARARHPAGPPDRLERLTVCLLRPTLSAIGNQIHSPAKEEP
jgi:hypothetical protein